MHQYIDGTYPAGMGALAAVLRFERRAVLPVRRDATQPKSIISSGAVWRGNEIETLPKVALNTLSVCFSAGAALFVPYCPAGVTIVRFHGTNHKNKRKSALR
jgi:hypothetical protein